MSVTVYGASDDLIEVDGDIREEFTLHDDDEGDLLAFSNGVVLRVTYTADGTWVIRPLAGADKVTITPNQGSDSRDYSDRAVVDGSIEWAVYGAQVVKAKAGAQSNQPEGGE